MVNDAQAHSEDDRRRREELEARNSGDSMAYQVERQLRDLGDRVPLNEKARAEQLIAEIRELVKNNSSDVARLRKLTGDLQQVAYGLSSTASSQASSAGGQGGGAGGPQPGGGDDVIDAEFKQT
jgi:molecular chaperone DnaK